MEFIDNIFGRKKKRQEELMRELGLFGQCNKNDVVGPDYSQGNTVDTDPDKFLQILEKKGINKVTAEVSNKSDTHTAFHVFAEVDPKNRLYMKATASRPEYYVPTDPNEYETFLPKLKEMGFEKDSEKSEDGWIVYTRKNLPESM